jgi:hypothetical protein
MALELDDIKRLHDKAYTANQMTRERAAEDMVFYWITQWDDTVLQGSQLAYRGEFNILRKAGRQIQSDLAENPVQIDFVPRDEKREDSAEVLDGMYRADLQKNTSIEAFKNAESENIVCGMGAWLLHAKYESNKPGDKKQVICRKPIFEANNTVYWDPNAKMLDKSDAKYVSVLTAYSEDGYKDLVSEITGEEIEEVNASSFKEPEQSYTFPWIGGEGKKIYVVNFYHLTKKKDKLLTMSDPFGETRELRESDLSEIMDEMLDYGYDIVDEQEIERPIVTKYIASGEKILKSERIAGEFLPVIPIYGEHAIVEGEEHWEGVTRLAKDPARLRDFAFSYMADILSRSPRKKPIYWPEQLQGFEHMYSENGIDNNYPYLYMNRMDANGNELPIGSVGESPDQDMPSALPFVLQLTKDATEEVANPGLPQDIADPDLSGKAILALQARLDKQSMVYQEHMKHAKRRDGEVYTSMAKELYDVPRKVNIEMPDGTRKQVQLMETIMDKETGELITLRDINSSEFDVYSKITTSYSSQKEQTIDRLEKMIELTDPNDPVRKAMQLKVLALTDGVDFEDIREYVNNELVVMGIKKPETPEQEQLLAQSQQNKEPDPALLLAMGENKKGDAALLEQKRKGIEMQLKAHIDEMGVRIKEFEAITDRMNTQIEAQQANAEIDNKNIDSFGKQIDNAAKIIDLKKLTNEELYQRIAV